LHHIPLLSIQLMMIVDTNVDIKSGIRIWITQRVL